VLHLREQVRARLAAMEQRDLVAARDRGRDEVRPEEAGAAQNEDALGIGSARGCGLRCRKRIAQRQREARSRSAGEEGTTSGVGHARRSTQTTARRWREVALLAPLTEVESARAVAEALLLRARATQHADVQVGHRRLLVADEMPTAAPNAHREHGKIVVVVAIAVADAARVDDRRRIEQRAGTRLSRVQSLQERGEALDMESVDRADARELVRIVAVMAQVVMPLGHRQESIAAIAARVAEHEGRDARLVRLERERDQLVHRIEPCGEVTALREDVLWRWRRVLLRLLFAFDATFELAHAVEIRRELRAVAAAGAKALEWARSGKGPYILEMQTYRYRGHSMSDPAKYRSKEEVQKMREEHDPIEQVRGRLLRDKFATEDELKAIDARVRAIVAEAAEFASNDPEPDVSELWTDITL